MSSVNDQLQNESITWIHSLAETIITDENCMNIIEKFISYIPNSFCRLNVTQFNNAIKLLKDKFLIWLRKMLCEYLLDITHAEKSNFSLKNKNKGHTALMDIFPLVALIADHKSVTKTHLEYFFKIKNDKITENNNDNEFDPETMDELHTNIEEIRYEMSEIRAFQLTLTKRFNSLDSMLTKIMEAIMKPQLNSINQLGSSNNPIPINNNNFPSLTAPSNNNSQAFASLMRASANETPRNNVNNPNKRTRNDNCNQQANTAQNNTASQPTRAATQSKGQNIINNNRNANLRIQSSRQQTVRNFNSFDPGSKNTEILKENEWKTKAKRSNKSKEYFKSVGTGTDSSNLITTVNKTFPVFIGRLDNNITAENIEIFLNTKFKTPIKGLTKIKLNHNHFSSYYFYVNIMEKDIIYSKNEWPQGLLVSRYTSPRIPPVINLTSSTANAPNTTSTATSSSTTNETQPNNCTQNTNRFVNLNDETENSMESNESTSSNNQKN